MSEKAILVIGHGSTLDTNESAVELHAGLLKSKGYSNVYHCYKGYTKPSIGTALEKIAESKITEVIAVPLFISDGHYMNRVIPKRLGLEENTYSGNVSVSGQSISINITKSFGSHPDLKYVLKSAIENTPHYKEAAILLIGHGSKDPYNKKMVEFNASNLMEMGFSKVFTAYNEFNEPSVETSLESMISEGLKEVIAIPMFISPGMHVIKDLPEKLGLFSNHNGIVKTDCGSINVSYVEPIGMNPAVNDILESMILEYL